MNDIALLTTNVEAHKGMFAIAFCWLVRELPIIWRWIKGTLWPALVAIFPYCSENGGVLGIVQSFIVGKGNKLDNRAVITVVVIIAIIIAAIMALILAGASFPSNQNQKP
jgi:hypothetical protein